MFVLAAVATCSAYFAPHEEKSFVSWMRSTGELYTGSEYQLRFGIYLANARFVKSHNAANRGFTVALNQFASWTPAEYKALLGHLPNRRLVARVPARLRADAPDSIDWRTKGIVNPVQDQGNCGSCWAFGTIQAAESAYAQKYTTLYKCSEQNILDCVKDGGDGCSGGLESKAFDYIINKQAGLLNLEADYPYTALDGNKCQFNATKGVNKIASYQHGKDGDEAYLQQLVGTVGVADVAIDASAPSFQMYSAGIYDEPQCTTYNLNHAVGCVGYGTEGNTPYWIIRNSWGPRWGDAGYIRMSRNKNNQCGVASDALVPTAA
jgi:cathepsin L